MSDREYVTCTETAKIVRAALKAEFPGVKFSVRSDSYAGGASIRVSWTDGPTSDTVRVLTERYRGADFDGMIDLKSYHDTLLANPDGSVRLVHFGADFIFPERVSSPEWVARCTASLPEQPNGRDSHHSQCNGCGDWPTTEDRWYVKAPEQPTGSGAMCCTRECAGRWLARRSDSREQVTS